MNNIMDNIMYNAREHAQKLEYAETTRQQDPISRPTDHTIQEEYIIQSAISARKEYIIEKALSSKEVTETKRIEKNVKIRLISNLRQKAKNFREMKIKMIKDMEDYESSLRKQIKKFQKEIDSEKKREEKK